LGCAEEVGGGEGAMSAQGRLLCLADLYSGNRR